MIFVKVVGGIEIYNFRIQCFVHSIQISGVIQIQTVLSKTICARRALRRDVASRSCARAPAPRRPLHVPPEAAHRSKLALPHAPHPEAPRSPPEASCAALRCTGPGLVADRRYVSGTSPYARRPRWPCYDGISVVTATSPGRPHL
jgi:hypothetical protein